jgi:uncharacterized protein YndB with AHSA1/START domain
MKVEWLGDAIVAEVEIEAAPAVVFAALIDPVQLAAWWGSDQTYRTLNWQVDPRLGGKWSYDTQSVKDGTLKSLHGVYEEFDPPRALTFTWNPTWLHIPETRVRITLEQTATGTLLRLVHSGFAGQDQAAELHTKGWTQVLGWLAAFARTKAAGARPQEKGA